MIPVIAIVGRPNVGKSTLFNYLTKTRQALVANQSGLTRDRIYGEGYHNAHRYIVVDTGGLDSDRQGIAGLMVAQTLLAIKQADMVWFLVDAREGLTATDKEIATKLRKLKKTIYLIVNKIDGTNVDTILAEFHELGLGIPVPISATHRRGIDAFLDQILLPIQPDTTTKEVVKGEGYEGIKIAFIGRPNVGKSTLVNCILGEERVIVYDQPGTTRDSIFIPFKRSANNYVLIDTAGIRKKSKIDEAIEKFSVIKALQVIEASNVVVLVIDAHEGITEQDLHLLNFIIDAGKALVIAVNKWDSMEIYQHEQVQKALDRKLVFIDFARMHFISALYGTGISGLFKSINEAYRSAFKKLSTPQLTRVLERATEAHQPPLVHGRRIKLRYAHVGGSNPPVIIIHGNQVKSLPQSYCTYLAKTFRKQFGLMGTPIRIELKSGANPYDK
jgi:GTPase